MFIKLLVVKMEENEVDLLLQVVDMRNTNNVDFNFKKDVVKTESEYYDDASNYLEPDIELGNNDQDIEDVKYDTKDESSGTTFKSEMAADDESTPGETNKDCQQFTCDVCHMIFKDNYNLKKHHLTHQTEDGEYKCNQCSFVTDQFVNLTRHLKMSTHRDKKKTKTINSHECSFCEKAFQSKTRLKMHASIHPEYKGEKIEKTFKCDICPKAFYESRELERHKNFHDGIKPFSCDLCPYASLTKGRLREHTMIHHPDSLPEDMTKIFICDICSKSFGCKSYLTKHISREHRRDKVYNCDQCSYETVQCTAFKEHLRTHTGERPFACHMCNKTFIRKSHMNKHIKEVHIGEKNVFCEQCPKTFKTQDQLYQHIVVHTGEKNFHCDVCPKSFGHRGTLANHKLLHTGEKPWACDVCGLTFRQNGQLNGHKKTHNKNREYPFKCDICPKVFEKSDRLQKHKEKKHADEKPFLCSLCGQEFTETSHLKDHMEEKHSHLISQQGELPSEKSYFQEITSQYKTYSERNQIRDRIHASENVDANARQMNSLIP